VRNSIAVETYSLPTTEADTVLIEETRRGSENLHVGMRRRVTIRYGAISKLTKMSSSKQLSFASGMEQ
jgi:hypothetical protein